MNRNILLSTDSYKFSHFCQYPEGTKGMFSYIEARKNNSGIRGLKGVIFFGLQAFIKEYLSRPLRIEDVEEAAMIARAHGLPFPEKQFQKVVQAYHGWLPIRIKAVKEGTFVPFGNALVTVQCEDPDLFWLASYIETSLLRAVWYMTTVCTISHSVKQTIWHYLKETTMDPVGQLLFKLHDFGARGASSGESAALGGMAHLVNFRGTDTVEALLAARRFYGATMAGFSIPAAEHSTITSWGRERESDAYRNQVAQFSKVGSMYAVVSDSYDIFHAVENIWGKELKDTVINAGGVLVVRPDSGDPVSTPVRVIELLAKQYGTTRNEKGFQVLNHVRVIQGDGIGPQEVHHILSALTIKGFAAENIAFGMGGGLLQKLDRDTFSFAQKTSAILTAQGEWQDVYKDPIAGGKTSKRGVITLTDGYEEVLEHGVLKSVPTLVTKRISEVSENGKQYLEDVYEQGMMIRTQTFDEIRNLSDMSIEGLSEYALKMAA